MPADEAQHLTRRQRLVARRRRYRWTGVLVASVIVGAAGTVAAFAYTDANAPTGTPPVLSGVSRSEDDAQDAATSTLPPREEVTVRPLSHAEPLRLWVGGDSLAGALGPALGDVAGATGVVDTHVDYKVSSGLEPGVRDWQEYAAEAMEERDPEAVVFMIGTNDAVIVNSQDANDDGIKDWEPTYRSRVASMMDLLVGGEKKRTVIWVGAPPMRDDTRDEDVIELNRVMREEAAKRNPYVIFVDSYQLFDDEDGAYTDRLEIDGETVRVRVGDGVHLTPAGAGYLAAPVYALLDGRFHIAAQADTANPLGFTMQQGGESTSSGSGSGSGSGTGRSGSGSGSGGTKTKPRTSSTTVATTPAEEEESSPTTDAPSSPSTQPSDPPPTSPPATDPPAEPTP